MKKFLFAIVCFLVVSLTVSAQRDGNRLSPEESAKRMTERMTTELNLTPEQVVPIDSINLVFAKAQAQLRENANGDFASIREDMRKLGALRLEAYEKILTDEQIQAYQKIMEERQRAGEERRRNNN